MENNSTYGIISIVCGVLSWVVLGIVLAPIGVVLGIIGLSKDQNKVLATIGLIVSLIALTIVAYSMIILSAVVK